MYNVISRGELNEKILTPCIIFYSPGDSIEISKLSINQDDNP